MAKRTDSYNLEALNPDLAKQWHPSKNGNLKPKDMTLGTQKKVWWICDKGHGWLARIWLRNKGTGCPYCSGRAAHEENCLQTENLLI